MSVSRVDQLYRKLLLTKFFTKGWGKPDNLKRIFAFRKILSNREKCQHLVSADYPIHIDKEYKDGGFRILEGHFTSPFVHHLPGIMPAEVETASFQMILPVKWRDPRLKPVCIHLAGTGDHFFWRRRLLTARPLLKESGIASIILENPYYGSRKPKEQLRSSLHNVSDLFVMGGALVLESIALLHWCQRNGWGPLGMSGISMGGHMASGVATLWPKPISVVPILSWTTASVIFTEGVMSGAIPWETLQEQFFSNSIYQDEIKHLIVSPEDMRKNAYDMGMQFVKDYAGNIGDDQTFPKDKHFSKYEPSLSAFEHHALKLRNDLAYQSSKIISDSSTNSIEKPANQPAFKETDADHIPAVSLPGKSLSSESLNVPDKQSSSSLSSSKTVNIRGSKAKSVDVESIDSVMNELSQSLSGGRSIPSHPESKTFVAEDGTIPSTKPLASSPDKAAEKAKKRRLASNPLSSIGLSYAKTKELQQQQRRKDVATSKGLHLHHAEAKSGLMSAREKDNNQQNKVPALREEAFNFMRGVMDECTHLGNFSIPVDPELIIIVAANQDAYIPRDGVLALDQLWPGSEVRYIDQGHVGAVLLHQKIFRKAIADAFDRQIKKYHSDPDKDYQSSSSS